VAKSAARPARHDRLRQRSALAPTTTAPPCRRPAIGLPHLSACRLAVARGGCCRRLRACGHARLPPVPARTRDFRARADLAVVCAVVRRAARAAACEPVDRRPRCRDRRRDRPAAGSHGPRVPHAAVRCHRMVPRHDRRGGVRHAGRSPAAACVCRGRIDGRRRPAAGCATRRLRPAGALPAHRVALHRRLRLRRTGGLRLARRRQHRAARSRQRRPARAHRCRFCADPRRPGCRRR
jgi:hypothetical protein